MKGLELPMNMIVVILIAVLVLVVLGAFFAGQMGGGINSIDKEREFGNACVRLRTVENCVNWEFKTNLKKQGSTDTYTLKELCADKGYTDERACKIACGCQIQTGTA